MPRTRAGGNDAAAASASWCCKINVQYCETCANIETRAAATLNLNAYNKIVNTEYCGIYYGVQDEITYTT